MIDKDGTTYKVSGSDQHIIHTVAVLGGAIIELEDTVNLLEQEVAFYKAEAELLEQNALELVHELEELKERLNG
jgi:hypothetical protein